MSSPPSLIPLLSLLLISPLIFFVASLSRSPSFPFPIDCSLHPRFDPGKGGCEGRHPVDVELLNLGEAAEQEASSRLQDSFNISCCHNVDQSGDGGTGATIRWQEQRALRQARRVPTSAGAGRRWNFIFLLTAATAAAKNRTTTSPGKREGPPTRAMCTETEQKQPAIIQTASSSFCSCSPFSLTWVSPSSPASSNYFQLFPFFFVMSQTSSLSSIPRCLSQGAEKGRGVAAQWMTKTMRRRWRLHRLRGPTAERHASSLQRANKHWQRRRQSNENGGNILQAIKKKNFTACISTNVWS